MLVDFKTVALVFVTLSVAAEGVLAGSGRVPSSKTRGRRIKVAKRQSSDQVQTAQQDVVDLTTSMTTFNQVFASLVANGAATDGALPLPDQSLASADLSSAQFFFEGVTIRMASVSSLLSTAQDQFAQLQTDLANIGLGNGTPGSSSSDSTPQCDHSSSNPCPNDG